MPEFLYLNIQVLGVNVSFFSQSNVRLYIFLSQNAIESKLNTVVLINVYKHFHSEKTINYSK